MQINTQNKSTIQKLIELIFYGNFFYGFCAVALMIETAFQMHIPYQGVFLYVVLFLATVVFYNYPYARNYTSPNHDARREWYKQHYPFILKMQIVLTILLLSLLLFFALKYAKEIKEMIFTHWFLALIFPCVSALYYETNFITNNYNLRRFGELKPFLIGFVWAGIASIYPLLYYHILHGTEFNFTPLGSLLFIKNFMFVSMLAILFDIKDYAIDGNSNLNTMVVRIGLRKTIFYVVLPLTIIGLITFITYAITHDFHVIKMLLIMIPFILLILTARSLTKRRTLMYYLVVIDGLLLVKALFGVTSELLGS